MVLVYKWFSGEERAKLELQKGSSFLPQRVGNRMCCVKTALQTVFLHSGLERIGFQIFLFQKEILHHFTHGTNFFFCSPLMLMWRIVARVTAARAKVSVGVGDLPPPSLRHFSSGVTEVREIFLFSQRNSFDKLFIKCCVLC